MRVKLYSRGALVKDLDVREGYPSGDAFLVLLESETNEMEQVIHLSDRLSFLPRSYRKKVRYFGLQRIEGEGRSMGQIYYYDEILVLSCCPKEEKSSISLPVIRIKKSSEET